MTRPITLKDLAQTLDLSVSTVARALADSPQISHKTKARVRAAAKERGYVVDSAARAMRRGQSSLVGLIIPDVQNEFYSTVAKAISDCCHEFDLQLVLSITDDDPQVELKHVRNLWSARAAGVVLIPSASPSRETIRLLRQTPHVQLIRKCPRLASDWFGIDDVTAMVEAASHLIKLGHRRIAFIGGSVAFSTGAERLAGFKRALIDAGLDLGSAVIETGGCDSAFGTAAMTRILACKPRPTATLTAGARITMGALDCIRDHAIDVPGEVSLVGFSDAQAFRWWGPGLTTIALPVREIALSCSSFLLRRTGMRQSSHGFDHPYRATHATYLIKRGSTAPPHDLAASTGCLR